jgi:serine protease inhibitor
VTALGGVLPEDQEQYEFIADRPFIYVQMGISDMPLFIGTVNTVN